LVHCYDQTRFERLLAAYAKGHGDRMVREFVGEFSGLSGSAKGAKILEQVGLARITIRELFDAGGKPKPKIARLLAAMQGASRAVKPAELGIIGEEHFRKRFAAHGGNLATFAYKRVLTVDNDIPVVIEAAFAYAHDCQRRMLFTGVNFSPAASIRSASLARPAKAWSACSPASASSLTTRCWSPCISLRR
jgi:hypothetical protein